MSAELDGEGRLRLMADSDSELTRGLAALLVEGLSGLTLEELLQVGLEPLQPPARAGMARARCTAGTVGPPAAARLPSSLPHPPPLAPARTWRLSRRSTLLCWGSWGWAPLC